MSVCVCVCERERERESVCVCVCVCERERERERVLANKELTEETGALILISCRNMINGRSQDEGLRKRPVLFFLNGLSTFANGLWSVVL